jgi:hypothetical protein
VRKHAMNERVTDDGQGQYALSGADLHPT